MKKTNFKKATLSALLMLIVAVISLTGVTYAWFTSGNEAQVSDIKVSISDAEGGLLISTDNKTWSTSVVYDGLNTLEPVSTVGTLAEDGDMKFFTAKLASNPDFIKDITEVTDHSGKTGYFVEKDIYFNNYGGTEKNVTFTYTINGDNTNAFVASRIALVFRGNIAQAGYTESTENFVDDADGTVTIFEPYATTHTLMGNIDAKKHNSNYADDDEHTYYGIMKAESGVEVSRFGKGEQVEEGATAPGILKVVNTEKTMSKTGAFTIAAESFAKVTVYVWIEGQDYDCQNDISGFDFDLDIAFSVPQNTNN